MKYILFLFFKGFLCLLGAFIYYKMRINYIKRIKIERENSTEDYSVYYSAKLFNIKMSLVVVVFALIFIAIGAFKEAIQLAIK